MVTRKIGGGRWPTSCTALESTRLLTRCSERFRTRRALPVGSPKNVNSPVVGAVNQFRFGENGFNNMKVVELVPGKRVKWQCVDGAKEWIGTEVTFDLKEENCATAVVFAHCGWREPVEFMHYCSTKWGTYLVGLKSFCEIGQGTPYPDDVEIG